MMATSAFNELMKELENPILLNNLEMVDVVVIYGMSFLHLLSNLSETFGFVGRSIFRKLYFSFSAKRIDNVCDKVVTPSIKDNEPNI